MAEAQDDCSCEKPKGEVQRVVGCSQSEFAGRAPKPPALAPARRGLVNRTGPGAAVNDPIGTSGNANCSKTTWARATRR